ncbi:MAG: MiaB/RimO family radical SAM methylthiotransferase [Patescibacteria group bacterium]
MAKRYYLWVLGCQMNEADANKIAEVLARSGWQWIDREIYADLIVVVACSIKQTVINSIIGKAYEWRERRQAGGLKAILTGCVLDQDQGKFRLLFDEILPISEISRLAELIPAANDSPADPAGLAPAWRALIPISNGCSNYCSYCVVPYTRGPEKSRAADLIITECRQAIAGGTREIILLGQNVNSYNDTGSGFDFPALLSAIDSLEGDYRLRFVSSHPKDLSEELLKVMAASRHVAPHLHLALQAGDDEILNRMNRRYTAEHFLTLVKRARDLMPDLAFSTDIIVGFPGETEQQFLKTAAVLEELALDMAYISPYSQRAGTAAVKLVDDVPLAEKKARVKKLNDILRRTALANNLKYVGRVERILVDGYKQGRCFGQTGSHKVTAFAGSPDLLGRFVEVEITAARPFSLSGIIAGLDNQAN